LFYLKEHPSLLQRPNAAEVKSSFHFFCRHFFLAIPERVQPVQHPLQSVRAIAAADPTAPAASAAVPAVPHLDDPVHAVRAADRKSGRRIAERQLPEPTAGQLAGRHPGIDFITLDFGRNVFGLIFNNELYTIFQPETAGKCVSYKYALM
jgi:hypothetical protein